MPACPHSRWRRRGARRPHQRGSVPLGAPYLAAFVAPSRGGVAGTCFRSDCPSSAEPDHRRDRSQYTHNGLQKCYHLANLDL